MVDNEIISNIKKNLRNGFSTPVYVNFTTWKRRDMFVPTMLSHFSRQTFKPTKIICWLSTSEYHHTIPQPIQECLDRQLLDEVRWVRGNTYCHKRWDAFKYYGDGYNLMIDDDFYYPDDYIETLLAYSLAYPRTVVCYYGRRTVYQYGQWLYETYVPEPAQQNEFYSGLSCFAPGLLPTDVLRHKWLRTVYCRKCDDSWVKAWLIKYDIPVIGCQIWQMGCFDVIKDAQPVGIWETYSKKNKTHRGVINKYTTMCDALYHIGAVREGERVWPQMNITRYRTTLKTRLLWLLPARVRRHIHNIRKRMHL